LCWWSLGFGGKSDGFRVWREVRKKIIKMQEIEGFDREVWERLPFWVKELLLMLKKKY